MESNKKTKGVSLNIEKGLPGFEDVKEYQLSEIPEHPGFLVLKGKGGPSFLVLGDPQRFFADYAVHIERDKMTGLGDEEEIEVYLLITVPADPQAMTANLLAPLLVNRKKQKGKQVVLYESDYSTRHPLFPPRASTSGSSQGGV